MDVFHEKIRRQYSMDKVSSQVEVIKVILEQRGDLARVVKLALGPRANALLRMAYFDRANIDRAVDQIIADFDFFARC